MNNKQYKAIQMALSVLQDAGIAAEVSPFYGGQHTEVIITLPGVDYAPTSHSSGEEPKRTFEFSGLSAATQHR